MLLYVIDDGTLDTVVACAGCDWEGRYNPECDGSDNEDWRISEALRMAGEDHECPPCTGALNIESIGKVTVQHDTER